MNDLRTDPLTLRRDLAAAVRFLDAFTGQPVRAPLAVRIPALGWSALWWDADATHRFSLANARLMGSVPQFPAGVFDLEISVPGRAPGAGQTDGPYAALEPRRLTLPPVPHSPPLATDYRVDLTLWPTVAFRPPPGETAVVGRVAGAGGQNVAGLKVVLSDASVPLPPHPAYTRTDRIGQFLFRLPNLRRGTTSNPTATLNVQLFDALDAPLAATPATLTVPIGTVTNFSKLNLV